MSQTPNPQAAGGALRRVTQLGSATEGFFTRIYRGLRGKAPAEVEAGVAISRAERRQAALRRLLNDSQMEVERLQAILAAMSEGIIFQDSSGKLLYINQAAEELIGGERQFWASELAMMASPLPPLMPDSAELAPLSVARRVVIGGRALSVQPASVSDSKGQRIGTLLIVRDVTQEALSEKLRDSFVTHISHELRTPLAPMRVASELLLAADPSAPPNRRMLEMIGRNIDILDRMVTEMIDISAMSSGAFSIRHERLDCESLVWDVLEGFAEEIHAAKLEVVTLLQDEGVLPILGDPKYLRWAISNLIRNAIWYNEAGGRIIVRAYPVRDAEQALVAIDVIDSGVGIHDDDMPHVFDLFYRGKPRTRSGKRLDPRGLGQGLYVARTIAQAHGGYIVAHSILHQGSRFSLCLPLRQAAALPAGE